MDRIRVQSVLFFLLPAALAAQPQPPASSFTLVEELSPATPLVREHRVELHFRCAAPHGYGEHLNGTPLMFALQSTPLFADTTSAWRSYRIPDTWDTDLRMLVIAGADTMQLDLPEPGAERYALIERAWSRWDRPTPEVIQFRPGHFAFAEVITVPMAERVAAQFAERLIAEDEIRYREELAEREAYERNLPEPVPAPAPNVPATPGTEAEWNVFWAEQPPLEKVHIEKVSADTVTLRITGRIMLTGACSSDMPIFGLEMLSDPGWVERIPLDLTQMDCGMPWGDWQDHRITIPLGWWVANFSSSRRMLLPGTYRLVFTGGNLQPFRTAAFSIDP